MPSTPPQPPASLAGETIVFAGRLSSLSHRDAQALVDRLGGTPAEEVSSTTTMLVVGAGSGPAAGGDASGAAAEDSSQKARRAAQLNAQHGARIRVLGEDEFCLLAGLPQPGRLRQQYYAASDILQRYPRLRDVHLRYLEKWGLVRPAVRTWGETYFAFPDLARLRQVHAELERGVPLRGVLRGLQAEQSGQLALDFQPAASAGRVVHLSARLRAESPAGAGDLALAERLFLEASALDRGDPATREAAAARYRQALAADPSLVPALINLGNLYYAADRFAEAQALYERAASVDARVFEAPFNLGNIHHDQGRFDEARACYERAIALNPAYPDARFYLAVTLEKLGRSEDAKPHWRAYQLLAPSGEWIELAREFSE